MRSSLKSSNTCRKWGGEKRWPSRWLPAILAVVCLASSARALSPDKGLSEYIRDRWGAEQGFPGGQVNAFAQTPDGYLWIGTEKGLVRFDGVSFVLMEPSESMRIAFGPVLGLAVDGAGTLWIRLQGPDLVRYRDGTFEGVVLALDQAETEVTAMCVGNNGEMVFAGLTNGIFRNQSGKFRVVASTADLPRLIISMTEMANGEVWTGTRELGLYSLTGGRASVFARELPDKKINALLSFKGGDLWIATDHGLVLWNGKELSRAGMFKSLAHTQIVAMASDRDSNVWLGTSNGLARINADRLSSMETGEKRAAEAVTALFEDREGNLWIGTARGIERLRDTAFTTYSMPVGVATEGPGPLYVDAEGRTWFGPSTGGLYWFKEGHVGRVATGTLRDEVVYSIDGRQGELWIGGRGGLTRLRYDGRSWFPDKTYTRADGLPQTSVYAVHESHDGTVWAGTLTAGLAEFKAGSFTRYSTAHGVGSNTINAILEATDGSMWFGTPNGLRALSKGQWRAYTSQDGLPPGNVNCLLEDASGALWIGTDNGIAFMRWGAIQTPADVPELLREPILGIAEDKRGALWIATAKHILRVDREKLLGQAIDTTDVREYGPGDGLLSAQGIKRDRSVIADPLGRIWFSTNRGISVVGPASMELNSAPALVHVEGMFADDRRMDLGQEIRVPSRHQRITLSYAGLSLSVPARVRFMHRLDGFDQRWTEPTAAREAMYSNLGPGHYRFRVIASNSEGIWNSPEATLPFEIEPTIWQTLWFQFGSVLVLALTVLAFFRLRVLRLTRQMKLRFEERLAERTRIAQELHDTLLQGVISASMQLHVVADQIPADSKAKPTLERILGLLGRVTEEGRNTVGGLRTRQDNCLDLGRAFSEIKEELAGPDDVAFHVTVEGQSRSLHPLIGDEIYGIGREALTNAFRHAQAKKIEVELEYTSLGLRALFRDNGIGFDSQVLEFGRDGHWGLLGMRERAKRIGARLRVFSRPMAGTEVELIVPGEIAFIPTTKGGCRWYRKILRSGKQVIQRTPSEYEQ
jgi:ligand-binding sensor domain-containing protein/signal transduction histidine kinase